MTPKRLFKDIEKEDYDLTSISFSIDESGEYTESHCFCYFGEDKAEYGLSLSFAGYAGEKTFDGLSDIGNIFFNDSMDIPAEALKFLADRKEEIQKEIENAVGLGC